MARALACACLCMWPLSAAAHDVRGSAVYLDVGRNNVALELHLPTSQLQLALPTAAHTLQLAASATERDYLRAHVRAVARDGTPMQLVIERASVRHAAAKDADELVVQGKLVPAHATDVRAFDLYYDAIVHRVVTHNVFVFVRRDVWQGLLGESPELLGMLHWQRKHLAVDRQGGSAFRALVATFQLGTQHIANGTDHLLFLLMLLLPAPLMAAGSRWGQAGSVRRSAWAITRLVTAFTLGHSLTLILGAFCGALLPVRPVEVLIATSIVISSVHALRPVFPGREAFIAAGFGLVHGLAFATALHDFGFDASSLALALLGFNLGIEAMQLAVVLLVMPWLVLAAQREPYTWLRRTGALFGIVAGLAWIAERGLGIGSAVPAWVERVAAHGPWLIVGLALCTVALHASRVHTSSAHPATSTPGLK